MFINLTPHTIRIIDTDNVVHEITPSGTVARVETVETEEVPVDDDGAKFSVTSRTMGAVSGLPVDDDGAKFSVTSRTMGAVSGLPDPNGVSIYIVSSMVLDAIQGRDDVFAPDTGKTAIRDEMGLVWAALNLIECRP